MPDEFVMPLAPGALGGTLDLSGSNVTNLSGSTLTGGIWAAGAAGGPSGVLKLPGDIVTTGPPPGVGLGMKPPTFLNVGDVVTLGIEGLGEQRQKVVASER